MIWPVSPDIDGLSLGQSVMADRTGGRQAPRPHRGIDIYVPSGTVVYAPVAGRIIRTVDGRTPDANLPPDKQESQRRAGLWVDIEGPGRTVHRLLHLGKAGVSAGDHVREGAPVGEVAEAGTSGLGTRTHLHYEIRQWPDRGQDYGEPLDPRGPLADALLDRAYFTIPALLRATSAVGLGPRADAKWADLDERIRKARAEQDPERKLSDARALAGTAADVAQRPSIWGEVYGSARNPRESAKLTGQAVKHAVKVGAEAASEVAGSLWDSIPTWAKVAGGVVTVGAVISVARK